LQVTRKQKDNKAEHIIMLPQMSVVCQYL